MRRERSEEPKTEWEPKIATERGRQRLQVIDRERESQIERGRGKNSQRASERRWVTERERESERQQMIERGEPKTEIGNKSCWVIGRGSVKAGKW